MSVSRSLIAAPAATERFTPRYLDEPMTVRRDLVGIAVTITLVAIIYVASFWSVLSSRDAVLLAGLTDFHALNGPKAYFLDVRLKEGEFPLWDPLTLTGMPYAAHPLAMAFYPPNLVRAVITRASTPVDFLYSLYFFILFHLCVGGVGMYLLARREGVSVASSIAVAVALAFSERWLTNGIIQMPLLCTVAWMPVVLVGLREAAYAQQASRRVAWAILAGVFYGFQILAGWPQAAIYMTVLYMVFLLFTILVVEAPRTLEGAARTLLSASSRGVLFGLIGALIGLVLILPAAELIRYSGRSSLNFPKFERLGVLVNFPSSYSLALARARFGTGPLAYLRGTVVEGDTWFSLNLAMTTLGFSSIVLINRRLVTLYALLTYLAFDLTFGPPMPLATVFERFALFAASAPFYNTAIIMPSFALLAGFTLDHVLVLGENHSRAVQRFVIAVVFLVGLPLICFATEPPDTESERSFAYSLVPAAILALVVLGARLRHRRLLLVAALITETTLCAVPIIHRATERTGMFMVPFTSDPQILEHSPDSTLRRGRAVCKPCNDNVWALQPAVNGYDPLALYDTFDTLANPGDEGVYVRGPEVDKNLRAAAVFKRPFWLVPAYVRAPAPDKDRKFPPTAAVFIDSTAFIDLPQVHLDDLPASFIADPGPERDVWTRGQGGAQSSKGVQSVTVSNIALPKRNHVLRLYYACPVPATVTLRTSGDANGVQRYRLGPIALPQTGASGVMELPLPDFDSVQINVSIQSDQRIPPHAIERLTVVEDRADEIERIHLLKSNANDVSIEIRDLAAPRALVFTEMNFPGWKATVDGRPAPILPAYGVYRAVVVPAGTHEVAFRYRPWRVMVGAGVSLTVALLAAIASAVLFIRSRPSAASLEKRQ